MNKLGNRIGQIVLCAGFLGLIVGGADVLRAGEPLVVGTGEAPAGSAMRNEMKREESGNSPKAPPAEVVALLKQALNGRRVIAFTYHGYTREAEPHALGIAKSGSVALLAYQIAGGSESEPPPGWRTFVVAEMSLLQLPVNDVERPPTGRHASGSGIAVKNSGPETVGLPRTFAVPRPSYRSEHTGFVSVDAEVRGAGTDAGAGLSVRGGAVERRPSAGESSTVLKPKRRAKH